MRMDSDPKLWREKENDGFLGTGSPGMVENDLDAKREDCLIAESMIVYNGCDLLPQFLKSQRTQSTNVSTSFRFHSLENNIFNSPQIG